MRCGWVVGFFPGTEEEGLAAGCGILVWTGEVCLREADRVERLSGHGLHLPGPLEGLAWGVRWVGGGRSMQSLLQAECASPQLEHLAGEARQQ